MTARASRATRSNVSAVRSWLGTSATSAEGVVRRVEVGEQFAVRGQCRAAEREQPGHRAVRLQVAADGVARDVRAELGMPQRLERRGDRRGPPHVWPPGRGPSGSAMVARASLGPGPEGVDGGVFEQERVRGIRVVAIVVAVALGQVEVLAVLGVGWPLGRVGVQQVGALELAAVGLGDGGERGIPVRGVVHAALPRVHDAGEARRPGAAGEQVVVPRDEVRVHALEEPPSSGLGLVHEQRGQRVVGRLDQARGRARGMPAGSRCARTSAPGE